MGGADAALAAEEYLGLDDPSDMSLEEFLAFVEPATRGGVDE